jgi:hypothetical protein
LAPGVIIALMNAASRQKVIGHPDHTGVVWDYLRLELKEN